MGLADLTCVTVTKSEGSVVVSGTGLLDVCSAGKFKDELGGASEYADELTADLRGVDFIDTTVVQYLACAAISMKNRGHRLRVLVAPGSHPDHVMEIVHFDQVMDVIRT